MKKFLNNIKIREILKEYLPHIAVIFLIVFPWFLKSGNLFFIDMAWGPHMVVDWNGAWCLALVIKILMLFFSTGLAQKILITIILLIILQGGKKVSENFIGNKWLIFISSLFFLFNPFIYDRLMYGQIGFVFAFGFFCLSIGYLIEYIFKEKSIKQSLLIGLFVAIAIQLSAHFIFFFVIFYLFFISLCFLQKQKIRWKILLRSTFLIFFIIFILNINWILPTFLGISNAGKVIGDYITEQDLISFQTSGEDSKEVISNILMMSGFWGKDQFRYFDLTKFSENWGRSFFLLLPLIIYGLIIGLCNKKLRPLSIGLVIIFLISVILSAGIKVPIFKDLNFWLFNNFPFYKGFREPQKWVALIVIIYGIFLSLGIKGLFNTKVVKNNKIIIILFLSAIIIMQAPLLLFGLNGQVKPVNYPADWHEINEYIIEQDNCQSNILFLPWHMYMRFNWIGNIVVNPAIRFFDCPVIQGTNMEWGGIYDNSQSIEGEIIGKWLENKGETALLTNNELNIRYIILAKEIDWQNYLWIDGLDNLKLIKETKTLRLYERQ